ncbi:hypothetical protein CHLNCDRAFT_143323 [Chlorella variabilis]|uniref:Major facilitator superfamily (MFS) profile domain-containing protein n=1 Tax=Chlorella variabilis TaxID=554065 RepID=E1Z9Z2_CHLVA|nr:hypothetical protein CHLNCDRAFT_143323 [Chlorella variabilis]EFN57861.1 hypothetical protein CHLNCDRAFT_143323 [Chlorella variabilis]|eukprot:XP_005849963.1 hypothetical protein CHLNCDRAFT_143323 [Chlorella variabilis]
MDRICLSVAMLPIAKELGWSAGTQGVIQSAFLWGYLATQLLGGTLADRYGGKLVMGAGIAWFSLASALLPAVAITPWTAAAGLTLPAVLAARFLVGFGEGVALPSMNNLIARHIDPSKKATALGAVFTGFHTGNLVGLLLSPLILQRFGWRALFYLFGVAGAPLLLLWMLVVPGRAPAGGGGGAGGAGGIGLGQLMSKPATWAIIVANFVNHWGYFIYLNWMPTYFYRVLGMDLRASSLMSFVPWVVMAVGSSAAGLLADGLVRRGVPVLRVRKGIQTAAFLGPVVALMALANPAISPPLALLCMTAALGITSLGQAGFVANMSDIAPRHAGVLFGLCNTFGSLAGILGVSVCGFVLERTGSFSLIFQATAALYVLGTIVWNVACRADRQF